VVKEEGMRFLREVYTIIDDDSTIPDAELKFTKINQDSKGL
jgi:hypothetical protein